MGTPREIEPWQVVDSTWILRSGFMDIRRDRCRSADGSRSRDYLALDLKDFAVVVAVTPARELLLCREYKHGARGIMHTLPAGFIEPGETPEQGARRELLEETGHAAPAFVPLGTFLLVPDLAGVIMSCTHFMAPYAKRQPASWRHRGANGREPAVPAA